MGQLLETTLLEEWVNRQDITWELDEKARWKMLSIVKASMRTLCKRAGCAQLDFEDEEHKELLFDLCRYTLNGCRDLFFENFSSEITALRLREAFGVGKPKQDDGQQLQRRAVHDLGFHGWRSPGKGL